MAVLELVIAGGGGGDFVEGFNCEFNYLLLRV